LLVSLLLAVFLAVFLAGLAADVVSCLVWMVLPHHEKDLIQLPDEEKFIGAVRDLDIQPGTYMYPFCSPEDMKSEEAQARLKAGPWGMLCHWPSQSSMGKMMLGTVVYFQIVSLVVAVLAHSSGGILNGIWFRKGTRRLVCDVLDGAAYGLVTALILAAMWPASS